MINLKTIGMAVCGNIAVNSFMNPANYIAPKHINNDMAACEQDLRKGSRCFHL